MKIQHFSLGLIILIIFIVPACGPTPQHLPLKEKQQASDTLFYQILDMAYCNTTADCAEVTCASEPGFTEKEDEICIFVNVNEVDAARRLIGNNKDIIRTMAVPREWIVCGENICQPDFPDSILYP